jgi:Ferrochelatase
VPEETYDSVLLVSFGGPEKSEDVIPFLENVLRGKNVPRERMLEVAEHYYHFGGRSPINDTNRGGELTGDCPDPSRCTQDSMLHASVRDAGEILGGPDQIHLALKEALTTDGTFLHYVEHIADSRSAGPLVIRREQHSQRGDQQ